MSKRRKRAAQLQHEKSYKTKFKKDLVEKSTMHYCVGCGFGYNLHEYQVCAQCGQAYRKSLKQEFAEEFEEQKAKIPTKERCQWCEIRKSNKVYENVTSNVGKTLRLCMICAVRLRKEKEVEEGTIEDAKT